MRSLCSTFCFECLSPFDKINHLVSEIDHTMRMFRSKWPSLLPHVRRDERDREEHRLGNSTEHPSLCVPLWILFVVSLGCTAALDTDPEIVSQVGVNHG